MNDVGTCNLALGRIGHGASKPITSLSDGTETANACLRVFQPALDAMLREYQWPFATRAAALELSTEEVEGWEYVYAYPADCAFLLAVGDAGTDATRLPAKSCRRAFGLIAAASGETLLVATHTPDALAWYTVKVTNPDFGDALFQDALAWRVAAELGLGLKADPQMSVNAGNQYRLALSKALAAIGNEAGVQGEEWNQEAESTRLRGDGDGRYDTHSFGYPL